MTRTHSQTIFRFSVGVVTALGLFGLVGWLAHVAAFRGVSPEWATMKPITCVSFLLSALALTLLLKPGWGTRAGQILSALLVVIGVLALQNVLFIDRWLLTFFGGQGAYAMSLNTSLCFLLGGAAIFLSPMKSKLRYVTQMLAGIVATIALVAICGYLVDAESLYSVSGFGSMAFNTAIAFGGLAMAIFATQPSMGFMRVWSQDNASGATLRRLLPVVAGLPLVVGWLARSGVVEGYYSAQFAHALSITAGSALIGAYAVWGAKQQGVVEESRSIQKENERFVLEFAEEVHGFSEPDQLVEFVCLAMKERLELDDCCLVITGPFPEQTETHRSAPHSPLAPEEALSFAVVPIPIVRPKAALVLSVNSPRDWSTEDLRLMADAGETLWLLRERCAADAALKASEHDLALTMSSITDGIIRTDHDLCVKRFNPMASRLLGIPEPELMGRPLSTLFPNDDLEPGRIQDHVVLNLDGEPRRIRGNLSKIEGEGAGMVAVFRDVHDKFLAQKLLEDSEALKSAILQSAFDPIVSMDNAGKVVEFNEAAERMFGYTREQAIGQSVVELLVPPHRRRDQGEDFAQALRTGEKEYLGRVVEMPTLHRDGTEIPAEVAIMQVAGQEPPIFTAIIRDLRKRRQADEQFRVAIESTAAGMIMVDESGQIAMVNKQVEATFGYARAELLGRSIEMLVPKRYSGHHTADRASFHMNPSARAMGERRDIYGLRKDGTEVPLEIALNPVETLNGDFVLCSITDITARKRHEDDRRAMIEQLKGLNVELERSLGEREVLLQEVHHRVKNNLQVISSLMSIQARSVEDPNAASALIECRTRVEAISLIHEKLYQSEDYAEIPFDIYVSELVENISEAVGSDSVRMVVDVEKFPLSINKAIPCGLVVNELVTNAMKHAFKPGVPGEIRVSMRQLQDGLVELIVTDNGVGMAPDAGRSNSLGLHLVSTLVRQLRGKLDKQTDAGTRFSLVFPAREEESR